MVDDIFDEDRSITEILWDVEEHLINLLSSGASRNVIEKFANDIMLKKPFAGPIVNLIARIITAIDSGKKGSYIVEEIHRYRKQRLTDIRKNRRVFEKLVRRWNSIMVWGYSDTLINIVERIAEGNRFLVVEHKSRWENEQLLYKLSDYGANVVLISFYSVSSYIEEVDGIVSGCCALLPWGVAGSSGSNALALVAREHFKPFVVVATENKIYPFSFLNSFSTGVGMSGEKEDFKYLDADVDVVPYELCTLLISGELLKGSEASRFVLDRSLKYI